MASSHSSAHLSKNKDDASDYLEYETIFTRLPLDAASNDQFVGYFMGHFGSHGLELLHLTRSSDPNAGMEYMEALKITGDRNVPASEISFRYRLWSCIKICNF